MPKKTKAPESVGRLLARIQNLVDRGIEFGLKKVADAGSGPLPKNAPGWKKIAKKAAAATGEAGRAYFDEYEKLKVRQQATKKTAASPDSKSKKARG